MERNFEVRVNLTGDEWSVFPVSAMEYLSCVKEAQSLEEKLGATGETELLRRACVLARGIYSGDNRVFDDGEQVLNALTPEEIFSVSAYTPHISAKTGQEDGKVPGYPEYTPAAGEKVQIKNAADIDDKGKYTLHHLEGNVRMEYQTSTYSGEVKNSDVQYVSRKDRDSARARETDYRRKVRDISDFLMRDSRRYDGGFELY